VDPPADNYHGAVNSTSETRIAIHILIIKLRYRQQIKNPRDWKPGATGSTRLPETGKGR
jgi:hypothetical protein